MSTDEWDALTDDPMPLLNAWLPGNDEPTRPLMTLATPRQSSRPGFTIVSTTIDSAVSSPSIPGGASSIGRSLSSTGCGAWSVAMASIVPSASPAFSAAMSVAVRNGGLTLNTGS